jgi:hypothetical protein
MSTPMRRLQAARAASWPDPEASILDALEFMLGVDDDVSPAGPKPHRFHRRLPADGKPRMLLG